MAICSLKVRPALTIRSSLRTASSCPSSKAQSQSSQGSTRYIQLVCIEKSSPLRSKSTFSFPHPSTQSKLDTNKKHQLSPFHQLAVLTIGYSLSLFTLRLTSNSLTKSTNTPIVSMHRQTHQVHTTRSTEDTGTKKKCIQEGWIHNCLLHTSKTMNKSCLLLLSMAETGVSPLSAGAS